MFQDIIPHKIHKKEVEVKTLNHTWEKMLRCMMHLN